MGVGDRRALRVLLAFCIAVTLPLGSPGVDFEVDLVCYDIARF